MSDTKKSGVFDDLRDLVETIDSSTTTTSGTDEQLLTQIDDTLCMSCGDVGTTRMLLTDIPFFRQVVVVSFECHNCGDTNNELQPVQQIGERAVRFAVRCQTPQDLSRRVVKTEWAEIEIPELEFEVKKQTGLITTIEGIIERAIDGLKQLIKRMTSDVPEVDQTGPESTDHQKICDFILKLTQLKDGNQSFTFILTDISGNSFVESLCAPPEADPSVESNRYIRTIAEDKILGIYDAETTADDKDSALKDEVLQFATNCPNCSAPAFTNMKVTQIPHFKEVVIMATNCDSCGHKTNEVKPGSGIEEKGIRITLQISDNSDLERDVVISDTCSVDIPELDIHLTSTGSGKYTTVEGVAHDMAEDIQTNPFLGGDSAKEEVRQKMDELVAKLSVERLIGLTLILDDPCGNSYVSGEGQALHVHRYSRTFEQNEDLGLNDIKTENYN